MDKRVGVGLVLISSFFANFCLCRRVCAVTKCLPQKSVCLNTMARNISAQKIKELFTRYDIRIVIRLSILLGNSATGTDNDLVTALGDHAASIQTTMDENHYFQKGA
ncbi:hypothetical protein PoB_007223800 [Plakobranchus ocellatus]|uniref:Uncharacterized protein n=1 Tax=Plakobranchus ocellatus TaxID=259542 RepID=A0AAV4DN41_9GAST|nr:hypothetical protein PoB_007223800 [Plakobranchus ocellatus]